MGVTLTDVLLFGKAQLADVDNATLVIYRRNILRWSALGGYLDIIVKGVAPISLPDAIANSLSYVKAFGGTEQRNLPDGYTALKYIKSTGTQYIDTGIAPNDGLTLKVVFAFTGSTSSTRRVFGKILGSSATALNYREAGSSFYWFVSIDNSGIITDSQKHTVEFRSDGKVYRDNVEIGTKGTFGTGVENPMYLFAELSDGGAVNYGQVKIYEWEVYNQGVLIQKFVPAKNSNNVIGMYDIVSGQFFTNQGTGDFVAGPTVVPTPDAPMDIVGNNGVLKARHQSGLPFGYTLLEYVRHTGSSVSLQISGFDDATSEIYVGWKTDTTSASSNYQAVFTVWTDNQHNSWRMLTYLTNVDKYYVYGNSKSPATASDVTLDTWHDLVCKSGSFSIDSDTYNTTVSADVTPSTRTMTVGGSELRNFYKYIKIKRQGEWIANFVPAKRESDGRAGLYNLINNKFIWSSTFTAGPEVSDPVEIYTDGTVETIEDTIGNTATAEMLLKVGDYQDVQSIIDGVVTRNVGVKVLDGTESFGGGQASGVQCVQITKAALGISSDTLPADSLDLICTHYKAVNGSDWAQSKPNTIKVGSGYLFFNTQYVRDSSSFEAYLADQYAAGTPVIVIYPLATPTTETVTGQTLQVTDDDNVLEITQASLNNLELEAQYQAAVSLTIQEVQDANLDPNVEVTIN